MGCFARRRPADDSLHLLNGAEMRSGYGFRSLAKSDAAYSNEAIIKPYSNWRGPIWINANLLDWIALRRYGFPEESRRLAVELAGILHRDIAKWGSMHEDYSAETGEGLAPTVAQSAGRQVRRIRWMEPAGAGHAAV